MNNQNKSAVQLAKKAHKQKVKVKKICPQMDETKMGTIKPDVFFSILKITNIKIPTNVENELRNY